MTTYVLDSNILITMQRQHRPQIFQNMWFQFEKSIENEAIRIPEMVVEEIGDGNDDLDGWIKNQSGLIVPFDEAQADALSLVMARCGSLVDPKSEKNRADPFVVTLGLVLDAKVVTRENPRKDQINGPFKIPDACEEMGVPWCDWWNFLVEIGWTL